MGEPELYSGEKILIRTMGVRVKSISFEAILTNKRIILVDRIKNLLPPKEIPLATIRTVDVGENAIRDSIIMLMVSTKSDRMRQMVLTFSREGGGNRAKERNDWVQLIMENISPSYAGTAPSTGIAPEEQPDPFTPSKFRYGGSMIPPTQATRPHPVKTIVEQTPQETREAPVPTYEPAPVYSPDSIIGTYCTRCGTKVPESSGFCNKCGSRIIGPDEIPPHAAIPTPPVQAVKRDFPPLMKIHAEDEFLATPHVAPSRETVQTFPPQPVSSGPKTPPSMTIPAPPQPQKGFFSRIFSQKKRHPSLQQATISGPDVKPRRSRKKLAVVIIAIVIIIAIVTIGIVLPKLGYGKDILSGAGSLLEASNNSSSSNTAGTTTIAVTPSGTVTIKKTTTVKTTKTTSVINKAASVT